MGFTMDYEEMERISKQLGDGKEDIAQILSDLNIAVKDLLEGGFKTEQASVKFGNGYEELNSGITNAVEGITEMATQLDQLKQQTQQVDNS